MATTCQFCLGTIDMFGDTLLREACPFCGHPLKPPEQKESEWEYKDYARVKSVSIIVGVIISKGLLRFDWLYITLLIPLGFMTVFAAQEVIDWVRHRKDPPGISLK
jgi:hypothetical protein